jgi:hypothetical protein
METLDRTPARNRAREITLRVRRVDGGKLRLSTPEWGWVCVVVNPLQLHEGVIRAFTEVEIASYARWKGQTPDLAVLGRVGDDETANDPAPVRTVERAKGYRAAASWRSGGNAREVHPSEYTPNPDGSWIGPSGRVFRDERTCRRITARRLRAGLPITPTDGVLDLSVHGAVLAAGARAAGCTVHEWLGSLIESAGGQLVAVS